ncbi:integrase [Duganella sp. Root336D2]|nr:integrase [Duganella sp. Root336D2]
MNWQSVLTEGSTLARRRRLASGKVWVGYYYNGYSNDGKRQELSLGTDLAAAKRKWAELECADVPVDASMMKHTFDQYVRDILPKKKPSTQRENMLCLSQLRPVFDAAPINEIRPQDIAQYRDARSAPVRANREIALLSHVFNMAREWGHLKGENPCRGVRKNKEQPRDFYADSEVWDAVYAAAAPELKDAMDLNYLTGQRPGDVLRMKDSDIREGALLVRQGKTNKFLRILLRPNGSESQLAKVVERILARPGRKSDSHLVTLPSGDPLKQWNLRLRFDTARNAAADRAVEMGKKALAVRIKKFQFRDIRAKSASEIADIKAASELLGHTEGDITDRVYRRVGQAVKPTR